MRVIYLLLIFFLAYPTHGETPVEKVPLHKTLSIRADLWCPFNCNPQDKKPGYMVEIAEKILQTQGYKMDYQILNWPRSIHEAKLGKIDAIIGAGKEDAEGFFLPKEPQGITQHFVFGLKNTKWKYVDEKSLEGIKLGIINTYTYDEGTNALIKKNHPSLEVVSSDEPLLQLIKMTESGRIIGFVESKYVLDYFLKVNSIKTKFKNLGPIKPNYQELFLAISPKHPEGQKIADFISEGTIKLRQSGELKKILKKYGVTDWK